MSNFRFGIMGAGEIESSVVPWRVTTECSELFDKILETKNHEATA